MQLWDIILMKYIFIYDYVWLRNYVILKVKYRLIGQVGRVFANGQGDLGSVRGRVIPKT